MIGGVHRSTTVGKGDDGLRRDGQGMGCYWAGCGHARARAGELGHNGYRLGRLGYFLFLLFSLFLIPFLFSILLLRLLCMYTCVANIYAPLWGPLGVI